VHFFRWVKAKIWLFVCVWPRCQWDGQLPRSLELWDIQSQAWLHAEGLGAGARQCAALPPLYWKQSQLATMGHHCQEEGVGFMLCYVRFCYVSDADRLQPGNQKNMLWLSPMFGYSESSHRAFGLHHKPCLSVFNCDFIQNNTRGQHWVKLLLQDASVVRKRPFIWHNNTFIFTTIVLIHYFYVFIHNCWFKRNPVYGNLMKWIIHICN